MAEEAKIPISDRISMRSAVFPDDEAFLKELYATTREEEAVTWELPPEQVQTLVEMQYRGQKMQYDAEFPDARHEIVLFDGQAVGRLMTTRSETELFGIDLAILTGYRSQGIGTVIVSGLIAEAKESGRIFNFSVLKTNSKAIKLYERLGCVFTGENVSHYLMAWRPEGN